MNKGPHYSISTPENVDLHLELAGMGSRIWAAFIDTVIVYLMLAAVIGLAAAATSILSSLEMMAASARLIVHYYIVGLAIMSCFVIQFGYFIFFEKQWKGQTPGKRHLQIRVIEANGQPVNLSSVMIRNLLRIVDTGLAMVGIVFMIFDRNERRLGDMLGGTLVIRERVPELAIRNLKISAEPPSTSFVDAGQLSPDEYHLLLSFLRRRQSMDSKYRSGLAKQMADFYKMKLNPEKLDGGENSPEVFLEKVYLAYADRAKLELES